MAVLVGLCLSPGACERQVDGPTPPSPDTTPYPQYGPPALSVLQATPLPAPPSPSALAKRCIKKTPEEPPEPVDPGPHPDCPKDPGRPQLRWGLVHFVEAGVSVEVELAETPLHQQRGLMYRTEMEEQHGMLFLFKQRKVHSFWMKRTCIPLDMMFIDTDGVIVGIYENVPTMNLKSRHVGCPSLHVLEVKAGWSRRHGVKAGQRVKMEI